MRKQTSENLPDCISRRVVIQFILGFVLILVAIGTSVFFRDIRNLSVLILSACFFFIGINTLLQFNKGNIVAVPAYCLSVRQDSLLTKNCSVIFRVETEDIETADSTLTIYTAKKGCPYVENMSYVLYIAKSNPHNVLAHECAG